MDTLSIILIIWLIGILPTFCVIYKKVVYFPKDKTFGVYMSIFLLSLIWFFMICFWMFFSVSDGLKKQKYEIKNRL